jgi:hypothetical protein
VRLKIVINYRIVGARYPSNSRERSNFRFIRGAVKFNELTILSFCFHFILSLSLSLSVSKLDQSLHTACSRLMFIGLIRISRFVEFTAIDYRQFQ